ncbi:hypothetical protein ACQ4WX_27865 [Streptomyces lasalocidi]
MPAGADRGQAETSGHARVGPPGSRRERPGRPRAKAAGARGKGLRGEEPPGRREDRAPIRPSPRRPRSSGAANSPCWPGRRPLGTTPEQREALELAVRHHLAAHEVAAVLGMADATARELLASAACEVERTRAALAVVGAGGCPSVSHLTGDSGLVLSTALRRELVRHVDDCPRCRRTAERAAPGRWPGTAVTPAELPVLEAPRAALHRAFAHHTHAWRRRTPLRPARLPDGPQGPRGPPRPPTRACSDDDGRRHGRRRPCPGPVGRLPGCPHGGGRGPLALRSRGAGARRACRRPERRLRERREREPEARFPRRQERQGGRLGGGRQRHRNGSGAAGRSATWT